MSTAQHIITRAFSKAGIRPAESPLSAAELSDGLDVLNDLLSSWNATGTLTGVRLINDVDDETLIPREAEWAVKSKLAVLLAGEYGIDVSQALAADVLESEQAWLSAKINLSDIEYPTILPRGSGNYYDWFDDGDFFESSNAQEDNF